MPTIRQIINRTIAPDGVEYQKVGGGIPQNPRWQATLKHREDEDKVLVIEAQLGGITDESKISLENFLAIYWREFKDFFWAQEDVQDRQVIYDHYSFGGDGAWTVWNWKGTEILLPSLHGKLPEAVVKWVAYCLNEFGYEPHQYEELVEMGNTLQKYIQEFKDFFGEDDWEAFGQSDFRHYAFKPSTYEENELTVAQWRYQDPDADEWIQVRAVIDPRFFKSNGSASFHIGVVAAGRDEPDISWSADVPFPDHWAWKQFSQAFPEQQIATMNALKVWNGTYISSGFGMHVPANAWYWYTKFYLKAIETGKPVEYTSSEKMTAAEFMKWIKKDIRWGELPGELYIDDEGAIAVLKSLKASEEAMEIRKLDLQKVFWDDILSHCQNIYRTHLELLAKYCLRGEEDKFWAEKPHKED